MSWVKRRGQPAPGPNAGPPPVQMYNPNQHPHQEVNQWSQDWYNQSQTGVQQQKPAEPKTQPESNYWQQQQYQPYNQTAAQYQDQSGYYQNNTPGYQQQYGNLQYNQQYGAQNNTYQPQQQPAEGDSWNWGWGDEDNSNVRPRTQPNNVTDSFANDESWDWSLEDSKAKTGAPGSNPGKVVNRAAAAGLQAASATPIIKTEPDPDSHNRPSPIVVDHLMGRRNKLETPQWSVESQMSQESSDDILQTSESDKSHMLSRSSTISHSPISGLDLPAAGHLEDSAPVKEETGSPGPALHRGFENKEIVSRASRPEATPPPSNSQTPPSQPPPPANDDGSGIGGNPYKRGGGLSHKAANKFRSPSGGPVGESRSLFQQPFHHQSVNLETLPDNSEQPDQVPQPPGAPAAKRSGSNSSAQQWAENNEAPINDRNQYLETGQLSDVDLNNFAQNADPASTDNDALPPPGLSRMVPGQLEQHENNPGNGGFGDEPPPGFSRMVPGQFESGPNQGGGALQSENLRQSFEPIEPPEGLRRMVPGESSSPESNLRQQPYQLGQPADLLRREREDDSEPEFDEIGAHVTHAGQPRSATIGADTPPAVPNPPISSANRSETIGADTSPDPPPKPGQNAGSNALGKKMVKKPSQTNRRDSVEGQFQDNELAPLVNSVRNLTVADNPSDGSNPEANRRRPESSDSEHEPRGKSPRDRRDRRYGDKEEPRDRNRGRYTPDKKYDRRRYKEKRYEEDTDYYSDKEKERRHRVDDREHDRKYASLRKEKDRRRGSERKDDKRDYRDSRKNEFYYGGRYEEDYENEPRSRASSRSDSMHDAYRERDRGHERDRRDRRHKEKDRQRRHRGDAFNPYTQGFGYDIYSQYYQQYHYYENLRKTNPQAYAQLYKKYYQEASGEAPSYGGEDRASVHSGRSSANDELAKDRYTRQSYYSQTSLPHMGGYYRGSQTHSVSGHYGLDETSYARTLDQTDNSINYEDPHLTVQRLTPAKFATAHVKASISSGKMVKILPQYPLDGQAALVELCNLEAYLRNDDDYQELKQFPGPLVKGVTHKKTIIEYCENKIKDAAYDVDISDPDSYVLLWELLILLIRQNGMVVGTDIAELLLKNRDPEPLQRSSSVVSSVGSNAVEGGPESSNQPETGGGKPNLKEEEVTNKFREYLLYGSGKEALEWAMKHGLWGHALFLASKLDKRTYANVLMRFANGLTMNDPLQTLYQLLSGKVPAAVTCIADEKWGDWRPHLAMILSNSTQHPELNRRAITTLGDTLMVRGSLYAAQFCYLMAETGFGGHGNPDAKLVLLGADHTAAGGGGAKRFAHFATNEAVHMTEIYEYACSLNDDNFAVVEFQRYKFLLATRLGDVGLLEKALSYLERIANFIVKNPTALESTLIDDVTVYADRLKYYDPIGDGDEDGGFGTDLDTSRPDNSWLKDLRAVQDGYNNGAVTYGNNQTVATQLEPEQSQQVYGQEVWQHQQQYDQYQQQWSSEQQPEQQAQVEYQQQTEPQSDGYPASQYQGQQQYWGGQQQWNADQPTSYSQESVDQQQQSYYGSVAQTEEIPSPQISLPNQQKGKSPYGDEEPSLNQAGAKKEAAKPGPGQQGGAPKPSGNGWFGGIFSKLTLKPKNQMKLPDDKNPSIVWDPDKKRWTNTEEDGGDGTSEFKPPPKMADLVPKMPPKGFSAGAFNQSQPNPGAFNQTQPNPGAFNQPAQPNQGKGPDQPGPVPSPDVNGKPPLPNMFKLQRSRNLKKSYIDVFNPNGKPSGGGGQPPGMPPPGALGAQPAPPQMNFFVPQPVNDPNAPTDFLTPAPPMQYNENSQSQVQ